MENLAEMIFADNWAKGSSIEMQAQAPAPFSLLAQHIPGGNSSEDYQVCCNLMRQYVTEKRAFILEDGPGNGWHLINWINELINQPAGQGRDIRAIGVDYNEQLMAIARMATKVAQIENRLEFVPNHVMRRRSPREIDSSQSDICITLACRFVPIFTEQQIRRYFKKISDEMAVGDLWCGSIALPGSGNFYKRNIANVERTQENKVALIKTSFGGETFFYTPGGINENTATQIAKHVKKHSEGVEYRPGDHERIVLNTFIPKNKFELLTQSYGLQLTHTADAKGRETDYFCVILKKI